MDVTLARVHEVGTIQGGMVNIGVILALYLHQLPKQVEQGGYAAKVQQLSLLLAELMKK